MFHIDNPDQDSTQDIIDWGDDVIDWGGESNKEEFEIVVESEEKLEEVPSSDVAKGKLQISCSGPVSQVS